MIIKNFNLLAVFTVGLFVSSTSITFWFSVEASKYTSDKLSPWYSVWVFPTATSSQISFEPTNPNFERISLWKKYELEKGNHFYIVFLITYPLQFHNNHY